MDRKLFRWTAQIGTEDGRIVTKEIANYWSPSRDGAANAIANTAAAQATVESGKKHIPITAELVSA